MRGARGEEVLRIGCFICLQVTNPRLSWVFCFVCLFPGGVSFLLAREKDQSQMWLGNTMGAFRSGPRCAGLLGSLVSPWASIRRSRQPGRGSVTSVWGLEDLPWWETEISPGDRYSWIQDNQKEDEMPSAPKPLILYSAPINMQDLS